MKLNNIKVVDISKSVDDKCYHECISHGRISMLDQACMRLNNFKWRFNGFTWSLITSITGEIRKRDATFVICPPFLLSAAR